MPIHDLGYRGWEGQQTSFGERWIVVATTGIRLAWRSHWIRRMLLVGWLPALYVGGAFFMYERAAEYPEYLPAARTMVMPFSDAGNEVFAELQDARDALVSVVLDRSCRVLVAGRPFSVGCAL